MHSLLGRTREIRRLPKRACATALCCALEVAEPHEAKVIVAEALEFLARAGIHRPLVDALLKAWPKLGEEARLSVCLGLGKSLFPAILALDRVPGAGISADCIASPDLHQALAGMGQDPLTNPDIIRLAIGKSGAASGQGQRVRRALVRASVLLGEPGLDCPASCRSIMDRELVEWARCFDEHRDQAVLRAVLASTRRCAPRLHAWLSGASRDEHLPLRSAAARVDLETAAGLAICWLAWPALVPAARRVFERVVQEPRTELVERLVEPWVLLRARQRSNRVATVLSPHGLEALLGQKGLSDHARRGLVELAGCLGAGGAALICTSGAVADRDAGVRYRVVRVLGSAPGADRVDEGLQDFGYDREAVIGCSAVSALARVRSRHRRAASAERLRGLTLSSQYGVRSMAERALERFDPFALPAGAEARWSCPVAARWMLERSPDTFLDGLRDRLDRPEMAGLALGLVRRLRLVDAVCDRVIGIASGHPDPRTRASATLLLGSARDGRSGERAFRVLAELLGDDDPRVRANAVESLSRLRGRTIRLDRYAGDDTPRVRANAIRHACACVEPMFDATLPDDIVLHLDAMLADDRPEHRLSAIWVVSKVRPEELAGQVARVAREDEDDLVRARARRCGMKLLSSMEPRAREVGVG